MRALLNALTTRGKTFQAVGAVTAVAGLIFSVLGYIPQVGETVESHGLRFIDAKGIPALFGDGAGIPHGQGQDDEHREAQASREQSRVDHRLRHGSCRVDGFFRGMSRSIVSGDDPHRQ